MKRYALLLGTTFALAITASTAWAQAKAIAPPPPKAAPPAIKPAAAPADPQRPDGAPAAKNQDASQPQDASPSAAGPVDPQRPDEHQPPKGSQNPNVPREIHLTL